MTSSRIVMAGAAFVLGIVTILFVSRAQAGKSSTQPAPASRPAGEADIEKAVLARLADIQRAAEALDPDKVFSYVLENDKGAVAQAGKLVLTRQEALEIARRSFQSLKKVAYEFDQQHVTVISPTVALVTGEGVSRVELNDGRTFTTPFAQSVVLVLTNGEWKVLHSHRSFPPLQ